MARTEDDLLHIQKRAFLLMVLALIIAIAVPLYVARTLLTSGRIAEVTPEPNYLGHTIAPSVNTLTAEEHALLSVNMLDVKTVPRVFLARLPDDIGDIENARRKKQVFVSTMLPLILRANELIEEERAILLSLKRKIETGQRIRNSEKVFLRRIEQRVRAKPDLPRTTEHINKLLFHVDVIPPSLAITQAAIESGWGTSRFAVEGNALFGEWVWGDAKGIMPNRREAGKTHKIKSFDYLIDGVLSYMHNLNRTQAYGSLRRKRATLRRAGKPVTGRSLALTLDKYSERGDVYIDDLLTIMRQNKFSRFDTIRLAEPRFEPVIVAQAD